MSSDAFCITCGKPRQPGSRFCIGCGASFERATPTASQPRAPKVPADSVSSASAGGAVPTAATTAATATGGTTAATVGLGLAAKLAISAVAVTLIGGATLLVTASQDNERARTVPAAQSAPPATPAGGPTTVPTVQSVPATTAAGGATTASTPGAVPTGTAQPELTVTGPTAVPYGEPAVFHATITNTTSFDFAVFMREAHLVPDNDFLSLGERPLTWSPAANRPLLYAGESFSWTITYPTTHLADYGMERYVVAFEFLGLLGDNPDGTQPAEDDVALEYATALSIVTPVRSLEPYWDDYCDLMAEFDAQYEAWDVLQQARNNPEDSEFVTWEEWYAERDRLEATGELLTARESALQEDFRDDAELQACSCWCGHNPDLSCTGIPWGTTTELDEVTT